MRFSPLVAVVLLLSLRSNGITLHKKATASTAATGNATYFGVHVPQLSQDIFRYLQRNPICPRHSYPSGKPSRSRRLVHAPLPPVTLASDVLERSWKMAFLCNFGPPVVNMCSVDGKLLRPSNFFADEILTFRYLTLS